MGEGRVRMDAAIVVLLLVLAVALLAASGAIAYIVFLSGRAAAPAAAPAGSAKTVAQVWSAARAIFPKMRDADLQEMTGGDGSTYLVLAKEPDKLGTLARLVEMNRRLRLVLAEVTKKWGAGDRRIKIMTEMFAGKASHVNQAALEDWSAPGTGGLGGWADNSWYVWFLAPTEQTDAQNCDSLIHEIAHCLCEGPACSCSQGPPCTCTTPNGQCAKFMYEGHGPAWNERQTELRTVAHALGLRQHDPAWNCNAECGNL